MAARGSAHSRDMARTSPAFFFSASILLFACMAKTTTLGSVEGDANPDGTKDAASDAVSATDSAAAEDGGASGDGGAGSGIACQIADPMLPVAPCPTGEYCRSDNGTCGSPAHCRAIPPPPPPACPSLECGCDGKLRCKDGSRASGTDLAPAGHCSQTCGTKTCDALLEYCWHGTGGVPGPDGGATSLYECKPIPSACAVNRTCACLKAQPEGSAGSCTEKDSRLDLDVPLP